ncbi:DUF4365 domain-containing protein [Tenacibaculum piscium]|uniref:DUF4365 domain-containing protein n=1 Tax=Tenacibaculum piscium TaxID=1458515 RepID=UPI00187BC378|nr:DUF4365 domain-containing protein [Tenacibaculum piscium]MBE7691300.1 DUF4365 domain-containing protein [Tenacibaculum piscium]
MANKKQRNRPHIMEDESFQIIRNILPKEWVIREFNRPDYGIDLVIELFENTNEDTFETLGEYIYIQVKSKELLKISSEKVFPVENVAKGNWKENKSESLNIDLVKFVMDTNSIFTIQSISSSIPVLLFLVDLKSENVYFLCLNDYIDKLLLPKNPNYGIQKSVTLKIPALNILNDQKLSISALKYYGKRTKLLSAFSKFSYQKNELSFLLNYKSSAITTYRDKTDDKTDKSIHNLKRQVLFFIKQIEYLDIWKYSEWSILGEMKKQICDLKDKIEKDELKDEELIEYVLMNWDQLTNLNNMYEELTREWFLPKYLSLLMSYPSKDI